MKTITKEQAQNYSEIETLPSDWFTVTQDQIDTFAKCTLDEQFIHVDPEKAAQTPFGGTIAHGFLSLSMLSYFSESFALLIDGCYMGVNYGFDKVRFIAPVRSGKRIRGHGKVIEIKEKKPGTFAFRMEVTIEIEGEDKPALMAEWLTMQMVK
ncbi:MAG: MaoC family dehydratase [Gammaproteobacteria bacterium]|nr:MaoC family dehydratase [Gammaproteobacteria bacterium]NNC97224.1 MaoC family dehydratase [Gammaproteobacteria bacterium]NNM13383.1 MaoC family dehydratase [Gammaproteobacteria bacterium]